jgi:hypothetical protein
MNGLFFLIVYQRKYVPAIFRKKDKQTEEDTEVTADTMMHQTSKEEQAQYC